jgi:hypothetical protein
MGRIGVMHIVGWMFRMFWWIAIQFPISFLHMMITITVGTIQRCTISRDEMRRSTLSTSSSHGHRFFLAHIHNRIICYFTNTAQATLLIFLYNRGIGLNNVRKWVHHQNLTPNGTVGIIKSH